MLSLILVDTALELIPHGLKDKTCVVQNIKRYNAAGEILDTTLHHSVMENLPDAEKRGRPDILHHFLLDSLGSPANLEGQLQIYFETPQQFYHVANDMRCPRDYLRFKSLMKQLIDLNHIPPEPPYLIEPMSSSLSTWLQENFDPVHIWLMTRQGESTDLHSLFHSIDPIEPLAILIGGFQKGYFSPEIDSISQQKYSIYPKGLDSWIVINRVLCAYEDLVL